MKNKKIIYLLNLTVFIAILVLLTSCLPKDFGSVQKGIDEVIFPEAALEKLDTTQPIINNFSDSKGNVQFFSEVNSEFSENQPLGKFRVEPGEIIDFEVEVNYEGSLLYKYGYTAIESEDSPYVLLQDWSEQDEYSWQIPEDIPRSVIIVVIVQVKNDDGIENAGNSVMGFSDDSAVLTYSAR